MHVTPTSFAPSLVSSVSIFALALSIASCGSSSDGGVATSDGGADSPSSIDGGANDASPEADAPSNACPRNPAPADRARKVVVSHPFGVVAGEKAKLFEVLDLSASGTLTRPSVPVTFSMGTALNAPIVFTPDGEIALVAQDDGSIGVVRIAANGAPEVIHAAYKQGFYAGAVVVGVDGTRAWILDANTANNGGGVYEVTIGCDGKLSGAKLVVTGGTANAMALMPGDPTKAVLAAGAAFDSPTGNDVHLVDLGPRTRASSSAPFGDTDGIASSVAVTTDGKYALVADNGAIKGNRVAVVKIGPPMAPVGVLSTPFPAAVVMSPFGNAAIVLNDDSTDQIHVLKYDSANTTMPFTITGELAYKFGKPQIPVTASVIERGALKGTTFVGENVAVRQLTFDASGGVTDTAKLVFNGDNTSIVGVVGVQP